MARKPKPSGQLRRGPFSGTDIGAALERLGAIAETGGNHQTVYVHPIKGWKVPISTAWTSVRKGDPIFNGILRTTGCDAKTLLKALADG
jgi:hypothetical protein